MSETPTLAALMQAAIDRILVNVHTSMPATVVSYDSSTGMASVRPGFKRKYADKGLVDLPIIPGVPVMVLGTESAWIRFPVKKGDTVLLLFAERSLETWLARGGQVDPNDARRHSLKDAVAIPGLRTKAGKVRPLGADTSIELVNGRGKVEITAAGKFKIGNDLGDLLVILDSILGHLLTLTTVGTAPAHTISPASISDLTQDKVKLALIKA